MFRFAIDKMAESFLENRPDIIVGIDARGFILAAAMAYKLGTGLAIIRKKGKLPHKTICQEYKLEYATNTIEMHEDAIQKGQKVLLVDDVLATGGTMEATAQMVEKLGGQILGISFLIELDFLKGREKLAKYQINSLINY
jgi:adenine phosphoribosyltransferase